MILFKIFSRFWICWQINLKQFESKVIPLFLQIFLKKKKKNDDKISSLLHLTSFLDLKFFFKFAHSAMPQNIISSFLILVKLRVDICTLRAKIGFPGKRSTSWPILEASNFGTMTLTMGTTSHYPKTPLKRSKVKKLSWEISSRPKISKNAKFSLHP